MAQRNIEVRHATGTLLADFSCDIPLHQLVLLSGPSGAGQRELLYDVLWARSADRWRLITGRASSEKPVRLSSGEEPLSVVHGMAMAVAPRKIRARARDTVGLVTGAATYLAQFVSRFGTLVCPSCGKPTLKSSRAEVIAWIAGACAPTSRLMFLKPISLAEKESYLNRGYSRFRWRSADTGEETSPATDSSIFRLEDVSGTEADSVDLVIDYFAIRDGWQGRTLELLSLARSLGSDPSFSIRIELGKENGAVAERTFSEHTFCSACRVSVPEVGLQELIAGRSGNSFTLLTDSGELGLAECYASPISHLCSVFPRMAEKVLGEWHSRTKVLAQAEDPLLAHGRRLSEVISRGLQTLNDLGLGYLTMLRPFGSLSHGERERVLLARQVSRRLRGALYLLDEPSRGLHRQDVGRLVNVFNSLKENQCTLCVLDHNPEMTKLADHELVFALAVPGGNAPAESRALAATGSVISLAYAGAPRPVVLLSQAEVRRLTGAPLVELPKVQKLEQSDWLSFSDINRHNLVNVSISLPLNRLICCVGVSGSGKSTLMLACVAEMVRQRLENASEELARVRRVQVLNQRGRVLGGAATVASFMGLQSWLPRFYERLPEARVNGWDARRLRTALRKGEEILQKIRWRGMSLPELFAKSVGELFPHAVRLSFLRVRLQLLRELGLDYLVLNRKLRDLASGELTRLRLAKAISELNERPTLLIVDEPLMGLNQDESVEVMKQLRVLVKSGHSVVVIEHSQVALDASDYVVEMGPGAGPDGGRVLRSEWVASGDNL